MAKTNQLMVRLDEDSKAFVAKAAEIRKVSSERSQAADGLSVGAAGTAASAQPIHMR